MAVIDCTLSSFAISGYDDFEPPFGTKKPNKQPNEAREVVINSMMPFMKQRPLAVMEDSTTTEIQANTVFDIQNPNVTLTVGDASYNCCTAYVVNGSGGFASVLFSGRTIRLYRDEPLELRYINGKWEPINYIPAGTLYKQGMNDPEPLEDGRHGEWKIWSGRAEGYRLRTTAVPNYAVYTQGANYAANAIVMHHLEGDDYALFKAKAAVSNAPKDFNPVSWDQVKEGIIAPRRLVQAGAGGWLEDDYRMGDRISGGEYDGMYVEEVIVAGGKYERIEGGNSPAFISGGTAPDVSRPITGSFGVVPSGGLVAVTGAFTESKFSEYGNCVSGYYTRYVSMNTALVVPTGTENSPRTFAVRYWRRVA